MRDTRTEARHAFSRDLAVVARRWRTRLDERLRTLGVGQAHWSALYWLSQEPGGLTQTALAERAGVEPGSLVRIIDALENQGLVERRHCATDRRVRRLHLTALAQPMIAAIDGIDAELRTELLGGIGEAELSAAHDLLLRIRNRLDPA